MIDERALSRCLARFHGVVTSEQLSRIGISRDQIRWLVNTGRLARVGRGVYLSTAHNRWPQRALAAVHLTHGALRFPTSAKVHGFRLVPPDPIVHIVVPARRRPPEPSWIRVFRTRCLPSNHLLQRGDGLRLTSVPRTLFDAAATVDRRILTSMIEQALADRWCSLGDLREVLAVCGEPHRPGTGLFRSVLDQRSRRSGVARSDYELRFAQALRERGAPEPCANFAWSTPRGIVLHGDLVWPRYKVWLEVDHRTWHDGSFASTKDKQRDRWLVSSGWLVVRITDVDIDTRLPIVVDEVLQILRNQGAAV